MLQGRDESVLPAQAEAREPARQGGDSSASVCQAEQRRMEHELSLTSPERNVNSDRQRWTARRETGSYEDFLRQHEDCSDRKEETPEY